MNDQSWSACLRKKAWVEKKIDEIYFDQIALVKDDGYTLLSDYYKWEIIVYFSRKMNFDLPKGEYYQLTVEDQNGNKTTTISNKRNSQVNA